MLKLLFVLPTVVLFAFLPQEPAATPAETAPVAAPAAGQAIPIKSTAESQAKAKSTYAIDCAMCHGTNGNGKGDLVADMNLTMKDLTNPDTLKDMSDTDVFNVIKNGKGKMIPEGPRAKDDDIWNLVIFVRSFAKK